MKSEAVVQSEARLLAGQLGVMLWRNNNGACTDENGRLIRYGLGNDSPQLSRRMKSSDLIGIYTAMASPVHLGRPFGVFLAVECKHEGWYITPGDERAHAQLAFICVVRERGGLAGFVTCDDDLRAILAGQDRLGLKP